VAPPIITREALRAGEVPGLEFAHYRKVDSTRVARVDGPFEVQTIDGAIVRCEDGYIGVDSSGFPYPIAAEVFRSSYEPVATTVTTAK
jgi:hypothetical protein